MAFDPFPCDFYPGRPYQFPWVYSRVSNRCLLLEKVPPAIRAQIYEYVLTFSKSLRRDTSRYRRGKTNSRETAIVRVNRLVSREALPIFYSVNSFVCSWWGFPEIVSNQILMANIRRIVVGEQNEEDWNEEDWKHNTAIHVTGLKMLAQAPKMEKVTVRCGTLFAKERSYYVGPLTSQVFAWQCKLPPITCFAIGRYRVATLPTVEFQDYWLVNVWEYVVWLRDNNDEDDDVLIDFESKHLHPVGYVAARLYRTLRNNTNTIPTNYGSRLGCVEVGAVLDPDVARDPELAAIFTPELSHLVDSLLRREHSIPRSATFYSH